MIDLVERPALMTWKVYARGTWDRVASVTAWAHAQSDGSVTYEVDLVLDGVVGESVVDEVLRSVHAAVAKQPSGRIAIGVHHVARIDER